MKRKIIIVTLILIAVSGLVAFAYRHYHKPGRAYQNTVSLKKLEAHVPKSSLGDPPAGVLTPTEFLKVAGAKYQNKEVRLRGIVLKLSGGQYALVDIGVKNAGGLVIFGDANSLGLDKYAVDTSKSTKEKATNTAGAKSVIITGVYKTTQTSDGKITSAKFTASSLMQQ